MWPFKKKEEVNEDLIPIECPKCKKFATQKTIDELCDDFQLECQHCKTRLFWSNCPKCETGYFTEDKSEPCPEC